MEYKDTIDLVQLTKWMNGRRPECSPSSINTDSHHIPCLMFQAPSAQATFFGTDDLFVHQKSKQMFLT